MGEHRWLYWRDSSPAITIDEFEREIDKRRQALLQKRNPFNEESIKDDVSKSGDNLQKD